MKTFVVNIDDDINVSDFSAQLKRLYPTLQIVSVPANANIGKRFSGVEDSKPLHVEEFKMYSREDAPHRTIQERFVGFSGEYEVQTVDWGPPVGRELW